MAAALITPPKDPKETKTLVASESGSSNHRRNPSIASTASQDSFKLLSHVVASPIEAVSQTGPNGSEYEPLPYNCNIFDTSSPCPPNINNLWQLVYSPLQANPYHATPPMLNPTGGGHPLDVLATPENSPEDTTTEVGEKMPELLGVTVEGGAEKKKPLPPYSPQHNLMSMQAYPPPQYYWGYHQYQYGGGIGYHHYPKSHPGHHHAYRPPTPHHGHYGKPPPFAAGNHQPLAAHQEYITEITDNDVICGRGGAVNAHPGNVRFRKFISEFKHQYLTEIKQKKPLVAQRVLSAVRSSNPPGRFLVKCGEIGYLPCDEDRAREKASQALREGAAKLRKQGYSTTKIESPTVAVVNVQTRILLPNEKETDEPNNDPKYTEFDPPKKKVKQEPV